MLLDFHYNLFLNLFHTNLFAYLRAASQGDLESAHCSPTSIKRKLNTKHRFYFQYCTAVRCVQIGLNYFQTFICKSNTLQIYLLLIIWIKIILTFNSENQRTTDSTSCTDHKDIACNS